MTIIFEPLIRSTTELANVLQALRFNAAANRVRATQIEAVTPQLADVFRQQATALDNLAASFDKRLASAQAFEGREDREEREAVERREPGGRVAL